MLVLPVLWCQDIAANVKSLQQHALDLQDLHSAKVEAQQADEASATLAAEVHQLQMEINAKQVLKSVLAGPCSVLTTGQGSAPVDILQADCSRIKGELADAVQSRTAISHDITNKRYCCHCKNSLSAMTCCDAAKLDYHTSDC